MADAPRGASAPIPSAVRADSPDSPNKQDRKATGRRAPLAVTSQGKPSALTGFARLLLNLRGVPAGAAPACAGGAGDEGAPVRNTKGGAA